MKVIILILLLFAKLTSHSQTPQFDQADSFIIKNNIRTKVVVQNYNSAKKTEVYHYNLLGQVQTYSSFRGSKESKFMVKRIYIYDSSNLLIAKTDTTFSNNKIYKINNVKIVRNDDGLISEEKVFEKNKLVQKIKYSYDPITTINTLYRNGKIHDVITTVYERPYVIKKSIHNIFIEQNSAYTDSIIKKTFGQTRLHDSSLKRYLKSIDKVISEPTENTYVNTFNETGSILISKCLIKGKLTMTKYFEYNDKGLLKRIISKDLNSKTSGTTTFSYEVW